MCSLTPADFGSEVALLERSVPAEKIAGTRYAEYAMAHLDSER